jgi:hypothetical protein
VRYTYTKAGLEQDIILRERPPLPEAYGLDPATTRLEIWTEFFNPPEPKIEKAIRRGWIADTIDRSISFGEMKIGQGFSFNLTGGTEAHKGVPVEKHWKEIEGRLKAGDVWKYGTTKNPTTRYSQAFLDKWGLRYQSQSSGKLSEALSAEKGNILKHLNQNGKLPPGNKIIR